MKPIQISVVDLSALDLKHFSIALRILSDQAQSAKIAWTHTYYRRHEHLFICVR